MIFDGDKSQVAGYLRDLANAMGLRDWKIVVMDDAPDEEDAFATIQAHVQIRQAHVRITPGWADAEPESMRRYMVHELIHCHIEPLESPLRYLEKAVGSSVFGVTYAAYRDAEESAVDAMAVAWAQTLPLPTGPKVGKRKKGRKR